MENLLQCRRNVRVKHLKTGEVAPFTIDCDVKRSSTDFALYFLDPYMVIVGHIELAHTSALKLTFQHWKSTGSGTLPKCS